MSYSDCRFDGLIIDNFAGGGGASHGIERALGRPCDYAINHDPEAIAMHRVNHPRTHHLTSSVWDVNPRRLCAGRPVDVGWFSPDCAFHSKARGGKPFLDRNTARRRRGLAGLIPRWITALPPKLRPKITLLENVEEFADWGPLLPNGKPDPAREGESFRRWCKQLQNLGYAIDMRELRACDYGAPTTRKRLFIIMRRDGGEIVFPDATHGPFSYQRPYRTAAECIDWSIPCVSIFEREQHNMKPLVDATLRRIARGIVRYVIQDPHPFIIGIDNQSSGAGASWSSAEPLRTITTENRFALVAPTLINTRNGERHGIHGEQAPRVHDIRAPYPTVTAQGSQGALVTAFLAKHYGGHSSPGATLHRPLSTITTQDHHHLVYAFLLKYYGTDQVPQMRAPLDTITTKDRFALVTVKGEQYQLVDVATRMLSRRELFNAQGFAANYIIDHGVNEEGQLMRFTNAASVRMCGNSVSPDVAEALVRANYVEQRQAQAA